MKKLNLIDLIALATSKPDLFKEKIVEDMFNQYKKEIKNVK
jgi:hypothetical protein